MKKTNIAKALLPFILLGSPAIAGGSSVRSGSRFRAKKAVVQSSLKSTVEIAKKKEFQNPFGVFGSTKNTVKKTKDTQNNVLAFLNKEGLLLSENNKASVISGEATRKIFLNNICSANAVWRKNGANMVSTWAVGTEFFLKTDSPFTWGPYAESSFSTIVSDCNAGAGDTTDPVWQNSTPSENSKTDVQIVINVDIDETGKAYAVVVADGATAPTSANVKAGQANGGGSAISSANITLSSGAFSGTITLTGLSASTAYDVYVVAEDDEGTPNLQNSATKVNITTDAPANNSDATLTAGAGVTEPVNLPSTADTSGEAVNLFDFKITDGGGGDGLSTDISQIVLHTSGTANFSKVTWRLNGNDVSNVEGVYDSGANTLTFSSLSISVADNTNETYTLTGYFSTPTGLTDNATYILSVGDTDLTLDSSKTQMSSTTAVNNGSGSKVDITATKLIFIEEPSNVDGDE